jgi:hypothetical protein
MKISLRTLFAAVGLLVAATGIGRAEEVSLAPSFEPFADENITLVAHHARHAAGCESGDCNMGECNTGGYDCNCGPSRHVGRDFLVCQDRCGGIIGGGEFLYLRPYGESDIFDTGPGGPDIGFNPAFRTWAGFESADGLGARGRYFWYEGEDTGVLLGAPATQSLEMQYIDAELTQAVAFRRSNIQLSGGFRYAENQFGIVRGGTALPANLVLDFDGYGMTFAVQGNRDITRNGCIRFSANARWSLLYGDFEASGIVQGVPVAAANRDDLVNVLELNIGPQIRRRLNGGGYLTVGAAAEAQYWSNGLDVPAGLAAGLLPAGVNSFDIGLFGFSASAQITR